jgi:hypothetical protein
MSDIPPELSRHGPWVRGEGASRPGTVTRLSIAVQWQTEDGTAERFYALPLLRQYIRWEDMTELLDGLAAVCREVQEREDEHQPPDRRMRLR